MNPPRWLPILLGFLIAIGPLSTDMYLPALPAIEASFRAPVGGAQITLAFWFAGLALGQITQGTLSDRFGRRRPLMVGLCIYTAATIGCAASWGLGSLSVFRIVAAFSGSAGMVIPRAVVRDHAQGRAAARMMSQLMLAMGLAPILAPSLGALMLGFANWRMIFWFQVMFGVASILLVAFLLPESLPVARRLRLDPGGLVQRYGGILRERGFLTNGLALGFGSVGVFAFLSGSPTVLISQFGLGPRLYGVVFAANAASYIACSQINGRLVRRHEVGTLLRFGVWAYLLAGIAAALACFTGLGGIWGILVPITAMMASQGFVNPNATVGALHRHAGQAGAASSILGTVQYGLGAIGGALVSLAADGSARPMGALVLAGAIGAFAAERAALRLVEK